MALDEPAQPPPSGLFRTRPIRVGPLAFVVESTLPAVTNRLDHLFAGFPAPPTSARKVVATVERRAGVLGEHLETIVDGELLLSGGPLADHELKITRLLNERKLDAEPELLHLHGAAVARDGRSMLIAGRSGSGKSSLTAALVRSEWSYLTDEQVAISPQSRRADPYPRPITLRSGTWPSFPELELSPPPSRDPTTDLRAEVSPLDLGDVATGTFDIAAIVFPRYDADQRHGLEPVGSTAETVERLSACCYDLERLGVVGMEVLVDLAAHTAVWNLTYRDLNEAVIDAASAFASPSIASPNGVRHVHASPAQSGSREALRRPADAHGWQFDDNSAIVFVPSSLRLVQVEASGFALWERLAAPESVPMILARLAPGSEAGRAALQSWLATMTAAGCLERCG